MSVEDQVDSCSVQACPNDDLFSSNAIVNHVYNLTVCYDPESGTIQSALDDLFNTHSESMRSGCDVIGNSNEDSAVRFNMCKGHRRVRKKMVERPIILEIVTSRDHSSTATYDEREVTSGDQMELYITIQGERYKLVGALLNNEHHYRSITPLQGKFLRYDGIRRNRNHGNYMKWLRPDECFGKGYGKKPYKAVVYWYVSCSHLSQETQLGGETSRRKSNVSFDLKQFTGGEGEGKDLKEAIIRSQMCKGRAESPPTSYGGTVDLCNSVDSPGGKHESLPTSYGGTVDLCNSVDSSGGQHAFPRKSQRAEDEEDSSSDDLTLFPKLFDDSDDDDYDIRLRKPGGFRTGPNGKLQKIQRGNKGEGEGDGEDDDESSLKFSDKDDDESEDDDDYMIGRRAASDTQTIVERDVPDDDEEEEDAEVEEAGDNEDGDAGDIEPESNGVIDDCHPEIQRMQTVYSFAQEIPPQDIAGPPIFTLASHWGNEDDEDAVLGLRGSMADILSNGSRGDDFFFLEKSPAVDFIVPDQAARGEVEAFIRNSSFEGEPPRIFVHGGKLRSDRFMDKADFAINNNVDTSDLEMRWSEVNRLSNREDIEDDWNCSDVPEERRRQFRLCYNYLLYMCTFTTPEDDDSISMEENDVEEEDAPGAEPSGTQDTQVVTQRRNPQRGCKNSR
ncbi:hypothetical protein THAOC_18729 [Thalassiosira oceanica]|uniref:Uncharacterized protein n=1 Tax=Thalassiosira oceanica TaxID=159749 RepID=K0S435_THAOC|nr:hypothetical protein THAOC_18729 [Thalassiosira oceanica]|eukprot:EJK60858.1 hypothetical protein THAOC_18729 [Thalassiosira oceanica]